MQHNHFVEVADHFTVSESEFRVNEDVLLVFGVFGNHEGELFALCVSLRACGEVGYAEIALETVHFNPDHEIAGYFFHRDAVQRDQLHERAGKRIGIGGVV